MRMTWMKWFPDDWSRDTKMLTPAAKGAWIEILTALHSAEPRGELTMSVENWARIIGCLSEESGRLLRELGRARVCDMVMQSNDDVMVVSRRMKRESHDWELNRKRVAKHREREKLPESNADVTQDVTPLKRSCNDDVMGKKLEARSQKHKNPIGPGRDIPPSPEAVTEYSRSIGYPLDGQAWCDSYAAKGWMIGKNRMKDWHATVRNWKTNHWKPGESLNGTQNTDRSHGRGFEQSGDYSQVTDKH